MPRHIAGMDQIQPRKKETLIHILPSDSSVSPLNRINLKQLFSIFPFFEDSSHSQATFIPFL